MRREKRVGEERGGVEGERRWRKGVSDRSIQRLFPRFGHDQMKVL